MKKAVIETGSKQYLVSVGDHIRVDYLSDNLPAKSKSISLDPLLVIDGDKTLIGRPSLKDQPVKAQVVDEMEKQDKVVAIRFRAKRRVHKRRGHRQLKTVLKITGIG